MAKGRPLFTMSCWAIAFVLRILGATWRVRFEGADPFASDEPLLGACWHETLLTAAYAFRNRGAATMISQSQDGELIAGVAAHLGHGVPARGSTSRGGANALRQLIRILREGHPVAVHCDGPRGPARIVQRGVLLLAKRSKVQIRPVAIAAWPCFRFGSWDRMFVPLPFARVICCYGNPIHVPQDTRNDQFEECERELQAALDQTTAKAERKVRDRKTFRG